MITVKILGDDAGLKKTLASSRGALNAWNKSMRSVGNAGTAMTTVGRNLTQMVTVPVLATGAAAVKMAYDFNVSMTRIQSLVGASDAQMKVYNKTVLDLQSQTGKSAKDLGDALYFITSSGYSGQAALDLLTQSAKASAAGMGDTAQVADVLTTAMSVYGPKALSAQRATDVLNAAIKDGKGEPAEFAKELGKVIAPGQLLGVTFDQTAAAVSLLTIKGQDAATATTGLRQVYMNFLKPAKATQNALAGIGTSAAEVRKEIKDKGLAAALYDLQGKVKSSGKDYASTSTSLFSNVRALASYLDLVGGSHATNDQFYKDTLNSSKGAGAAAESFDKWKASVSGKFLIAMGQLKTDLTVIGGQMLPKLVGWLSKVVAKFHDMSPEQKKQAEHWALIAAAVGPLLMMFGKLLTTFSLIARHPLLTALIALGAYLVKLYATNKSFRDIVNEVAHALGTAAKFVNDNRTAITAILLPLGTAIVVFTALTRGLALAKTAMTAFKAAVVAVNLVMETNPIFLAIAAIAALVVGVIYAYKHFATFRNVVDTTFSWIKDHWPLLLDIILGPIGMAAGAIIGHWHSISAGAKSTKDGIVSAFQAIEGPLKAVFDAIKWEWDHTIGVMHVPAAVSKVGGLLGKVGGAVSGVASTIAGARASGGPVTGGNTYLVGEKGPELVTMGQSGFVSTASDTAKMFGNIGKVSDSTAALSKTSHTQKTQYDNAKRRYHQLLARPQKTQAQRDALVNAKSNMDQQKKDYDAAAKAVVAAQKADKALQAQYKKGAPLLTKAAGLVGFGDHVGPVEKQANAMAAAIQKQFADKDGNIPAAAQAAIDRLNDLASQAASARTGLISSLTGDSDFVSQLQSGDTSTAGIQTFLTGQVNKIKALGNDLKILSSRGLPPSMLAQLAAGGLAALPIADSLASASSADLAGIVATQSQINTLTSALGDSTQKAIFSAPDSPTGDLTGTKIKDAPAGTVQNITVNAQTNASAAQIAADAAWHLRTISA